MQAQLSSEAQGTVAWHDFVPRLAAHLAAQWPAMEALLAERYHTFVQLAVEQARNLGLRQPASVGRYVNLCFVWGPSFQERPEYAWAAQHLSDASERPALAEWASLHQLLQRSLTELQGLAGAKVDAASLRAADARLLDAIEAWAAEPRAGLARVAAAPPLPRAACDLEAVELRVLPAGVAEGGERPAPVAQDYHWQAGGWQRLPRPEPAPLRIDSQHPLPALISVLAPVAGQGEPCRLQLRARSHASCNGDHHPALSVTGPQDRLRWQGHETRALNWPMVARAPSSRASGPGCLVAEESSPEYYKLELQVCGLRDQGEALGSQHGLIQAWPAAQWWVEIQRPRLAMEQRELITPSHQAQRQSLSRCRVERDGEAQDAQALQAQLDQGLDAACAQALCRLAEAWAQVPALQQPKLEGSLGLLRGSAAFSWGWRLGAEGLAASAWMGLQAQLQLEACLADLEFSAELQLGDARSRLSLRCAGRAELQAQLNRSHAGEPLPALMAQTVSRWRLPLSLSLDPLASETGALLQPVSAPQAALIGELGLRPNSKVGSGWEWYAKLQLEAVSLELLTQDPLMGPSQQTLQLLPALPLLDWSMA